MYLERAAWLDVLRAEYLRDFIRRGGAAVKFAVPLAVEDNALLRDDLAALARHEGYQFCLVDAAATRLQMIDKLCHDVARQLDWPALVRSALARMLTARRYLLPPAGSELSVRRLAQVNEREEEILRQELLRLLEAEVFRDYAMCKEFRAAMFYLCLAELDPVPQHAALAQALQEWLRGELPRISTLKSALIFQRIARHNARHVFASLCHWLHRAGFSGLLLALDIARLAVKRPKEGASGHYYSVPAVMDAYELLRQFIDGTEDLGHCLVVVLADAAFLSDERRGLAAYDALRMRVADEVRDRGRVNPLGALIRLGACEPDRPAPTAREAARG